MPGSTVPPIRIVEPAGENLFAFASKLTNTCVMRDIRQHGVAQAARRFDLGLVANDLHLLVLRRRRAGDLVSCSKTMDMACPGFDSDSAW